MNKRRILAFSLFLAGFAFLGAGCLNNNTNTNINGQVKGAEENFINQAKVTLLVNNGEGRNAYNITVPAGAKALEALKSASENYYLGLVIKESGMGAYVQTLVGKNGGDDKKYWMFYINGASANVGISEQAVKDGDEIEFKFE